MDKEVKELIKQLKEMRDNPIYGEEGYIVENLIMFDGDKCKLLLDYINQLETNRDEAIEHIEENRDYQDILIGRTKWENGKFFTEDILREENIKELLSILERGKE